MTEALLEKIVGGLKYPSYFLVALLVNMFKDTKAGDNSRLVILLGFALMVVIIISAREVFTKRNTGFFDALGAKARNAFLAGPSAENLTGRWEVRWFEGEGDNRRVYETDPVEHIEITAHQCRVVCKAFDPSSKHSYWLDGRVSTGGMLALNYWSDPDPEVAAKVGEDDVPF